MSLKLRVKVVKIGNSLRVTIPQPIAEQLKIRAGDSVLMSLKAGKILVEKESP